MTVQDLVNKSTAGDGIPDWEKILYGLDPTKSKTASGIPDSVAISKIIATNQEANTENVSENNQDAENLNKTDQFSKDLFSTVASLNESGNIDQTTIDQVSGSLADEIQNTTPRKVYTLADIKIINNDTTVAIQKYKNTLIGIYEKYPTQTRVEDVLAKFVGDGTTVDESALAGLTPIITQTQEIINGWIKTAVPDQLTQLHLDVINAMERLLENVTDMQLYDNDPIVAIGAIENYQKNIPLLQAALDAHANAVNQKLNS
jgi:hypothetical protein